LIKLPSGVTTLPVVADVVADVAVVFAVVVEPVVASPVVVKLGRTGLLVVVSPLPSPQETKQKLVAINAKITAKTSAILLSSFFIFSLLGYFCSRYKKTRKLPSFCFV
jgi:hypothetical protein